MQRRPQCNDSFNFHSYSFIYLCIYLSIYLLYHFIVVLIQRRHVAISDNFVFQFIHTTAHSINWTLPPNTLHPTPYTLHPTPYTLHPTPYTLPCTGTFIPRHLFSGSSHAVNSRTSSRWVTQSSRRTHAQIRPQSHNPPPVWTHMRTHIRTHTRTHIGTRMRKSALKFTTRLRCGHI